MNDEIISKRDIPHLILSLIKICALILSLYLLLN